MIGARIDEIPRIEEQEKFDKDCIGVIPKPEEGVCHAEEGMLKASDACPDLTTEGNLF